ncbi:hypothetical protein SAMN05192534_10311 [Alteribacillus persepolensis]|uniref:Helix-turn-helix domain-containing protein n=1 Tax=Alteribacillus persepolensis TaxID=568899 RepID=A0A1G8AV27_9BACI|nr:hypothetical protein [Alteribacillus persepolensis]SDH24220.1 hypothetical protein SAMN05192534_10311 [Alteribacillus persepolensis]
MNQRLTTNVPEDVMELLRELEPSISYSLRETKKQDREDLKQEMIVKMLEKREQIGYSDAPGFWEFIKRKTDSC